MPRIKLLLCKSIDKLGIVGDVVHVAPGYARNYLLPQGLATEPTETNVRALAEARKQAELERERKRAAMAALAQRLQDVEVTIRARANDQGHLYGSVGPKEISAALQDEGYGVHADQVVLVEPIRQLDNVPVELRFGDGLTASVKVWVVREKVEGEQAEDEEGMEEAGTTEEVAVGMEADPNDRDNQD